jgi:hypothetical protein
MVDAEIDLNTCIGNNNGEQALGISPILTY